MWSSWEVNFAWRRGGEQGRLKQVVNVNMYDKVRQRHVGPKEVVNTKTVEETLNLNARSEEKSKRKWHKRASRHLRDDSKWNEK
jgi:hypothetical protein